MRICTFKHTSTQNIIRGDWTPFSPRFYPFAEVSDLCNPCFRWRFLELIRGNFPRWGALLVNPNDPNEEYPQYYRVSANFKNFAVVLMRALSRSSHPGSIIRNIQQPGLLLNSISGMIEPENYHLNAINLIGELFERLNNAEILGDYISSEHTLFNLTVINENFDIYRQDSTRVSMTQLRRAGIGGAPQRPPQTFSWRGPISITGTIPIIHLERQEIRVPVPIADSFFSPELNIDLTDDIITPLGIRSFFVINELHKMWILRESLAQLIDDQIYRNELCDGLGNVIHNSRVDLTLYNFRDFNIIVDTIDHSIPIDPNMDFKEATGQAVIVYDLLYQPYPNIVNSFQGFDPCPIKIGEDPDNRYQCPLGGTMGCGMKDKRIQNLQFPRDRIETNIYKFLRLLRDESVFSHEALYKLTRLHPDMIDELNEYSDFWVGNLFQDSFQRWIFQPITSQYWNAPRISDKKMYELSLISPICYESDFRVKIISRIGDRSFEISPVIKFNPWIEEYPFNNNAPVPCIIGQLSVRDNNININRQKKQLVKSIQYSTARNTRLSRLPPGQRENEILRRRLEDRDTRVGMATFGRYARFV